jgi:tetratricopeptide (TPR) repeat protein
MNLGMALRMTGDLEGALRHLRRSVAKDPVNAEAHYYIGDLLRQQGDLEGAAQAFEAALFIRPDMQEGYYGLGSVRSSSQIRQPTTARPPSGQRPGPFQQAVDFCFQGELGRAKDRCGWRSICSNYAEAHNLLGFPPRLNTSKARFSI